MELLLKQAVGVKRGHDKKPALDEPAAPRNDEVRQ